MTIILFLLLGLLAGVLSGLIGIGGGVIIVPALVFVFGYSQQMAQGTTIALMVPPIGILAAWTYYQKGYVDVKVASLICIGFVVGGLLGSTVAANLSPVMLEKIFGGVLLIIALKMLLA
ncbi:MAG: sulfite exporter TauE/SafE family protein [Pelobacteraceae bacterium]